MLGGLKLGKDGDRWKVEEHLMGSGASLPENVLSIVGRQSSFLWRFRISLTSSEEMASGLTKVFVSYLQTGWKSNLNSKNKVLRYIHACVCVECVASPRGQECAGCLRTGVYRVWEPLAPGARNPAVHLEKQQSF